MIERQESRHLNIVSSVALLTALSLSLSLYIIGLFSKSGYVKVHLLYITGIFLTLPLIVVCRWLVQRWKIVIPPKVLTFFWIIVACFLLYKSHFLFFPVTYIIQSGYWFLFLVFAILFSLCCLNRMPKKIKQIIYYCLIVQTGFLAFILFKDYAFWFAGSSTMLGNFNAVFSSIVQAVHGKLPLVDYYAQYGYYSGLLSIVFHIIPLTLATYSAVLAILVLCVFVFLFLGLRKLVINPFICIAVIMACFYGQFYFAQIVYWAVLPIRLIFPFLGFWFIASYNVNKSSRLYHMIFFVVTLSLSWNIDTGAVLFLSWLLFLSYNVMPSIKAILKIWLTGFVYVAMLLALYAAYAWVTRGILPHYQDIFIFQELFFGKGFVSYPMQVFGAWCLLMFVYLAGFVHAFHKRAPLVFFLCLMGTGIFSYFIMRSYPTNIFVVTWPALILLGIFADAMLKHRRLWMAFFAILPLVFWSMGAVASALTTVYPNNTASMNGWKHLSLQRQWVKSLGLSNKNVIILATNSGIFYMDSHAISPVVMPGTAEIDAPIFINRIVHYAENKHSHGFLLLDAKLSDYPIPLFDPIRKLVASLPVVKKSPDRILTLYGIHETVKRK